MNRIVAIPVIISLFFLASCGKADDPSETAATSQQSTAASGTDAVPAGGPIENTPKAPSGSKLVQAPVGEGEAIASRLMYGQTLHGSYISDRDATLLGFGVRIGNSRGSSDGSLELNLCQADACQEASIRLKGTIDNGFAIFTLPMPLEVKSGQTYSYSLARSMDATNSLAVWLHPAPAGAPTVVDAEGNETGRVAKLGLYFKE